MAELDFSVLARVRARAGREVLFYFGFSRDRGRGNGDRRFAAFAFLLRFLLCVAVFAGGRATAADEVDPCLATSAATAVKAPPPRVYHYVVLLDTSMSMVGRGDGKGRVLLPQVKEEIGKLLESLPAGSRVTIQPFDDGPKRQETFELPKEKSAALQFVHGIEARGKRTCIYRTLKHVLSSWPGSEDAGVLVFLFTDGNNNCQPPPTLEEVNAEYRLRRGPYDWMHYILLGLEIAPELEELLGREEGWKLLAVPPNKVPRLPVVEVEPKLLELGNLQGANSAARELRVRAGSEQEGALHLRVRAVSPDLSAHGAALAVSPEEISVPGLHTVTFQLLNRESLPDGENYGARLCIESNDPEVVMKPVSVPLRFRYHPAGVFDVEAVEATDSVTLEQGASASLRYRLKGDRWARGTVTAAAQGTFEGLELLLNGGPGPIQLTAGDLFSVQMKNAGIQSRDPLKPELAFSYPPETTGPATLALPFVVRPVTCWEKLLDWWWLWPLLALLLFAVGMALWNRFQPWGQLTGTGPPPACRNLSATLRGRKPVDLGRLLGLDELAGIAVQRTGRGLPVVKHVREDLSNLRLETQGYPLEVGDPIEFDEEIRVRVGDQEIATFSITRPK
ncbi:MAG: VWA domain-containing protein [Candidatus Binatia bacterium]|nr:VWA domain-containing protein [Candidatus Binatia bacterium]